MRKFLCLFLNTGGGHRETSRVLKLIMNEYHPDAEVVLQEGFKQKDHLFKFFVEKMYGITCNYIPGGWAFFYEISKSVFFQRMINIAVHPHITRNIRSIIRKTNCTDIVCFHFLLTPAVISAIRSVNKSIRFTVIVTDPFTCSNAWFYEKDVSYIVASDKVKQFAITKCNIKDENIKILPFLINPKYYSVISPSEIEILRAKYEIPKQNKVLLITGGGGGMPNLVNIMKEFVKLKPNFTIMVVCGHDKATRRALKVALKLYSQYDIRILGFINYMDDLIKLCDCAIIKAGPSTVLEVLCSKKPVIISTYLHGQEFGNMQFATQNKVGVYIRKPKQIAKAAYTLLNNQNMIEEAGKNLHQLTIDKDLHKIADYLYES